MNSKLFGAISAVIVALSTLGLTLFQVQCSPEKELVIELSQEAE